MISAGQPGHDGGANRGPSVQNPCVVTRVGAGQPDGGDPVGRKVVLTNSDHKACRLSPKTSSKASVPVKGRLPAVAFARSPSRSPCRSCSQERKRAPYAYGANPPGQSTRPPFTRSSGSNRCARTASPRIALKSPPVSRPRPVRIVSDHVAYPSTCQVGSHRFGKATGVRPNKPRNNLAQPSERSRCTMCVNS
jgi:hypothetical protein